MKKPFQLIGVGSPVVDSLCQVEESVVASLPGEKGGMLLVEAPELAELMSQFPKLTEAPGGSAGNTAVAVARLGLPTTFLGKLGNDVGGEFYRKSFAALGGDGSRFKVGEVPNARCLSLVTPDSERTMRTCLGAAMTLSPEEVSVDDFQGCQHAHIEGYLLFNRALMQRVLDCAREAGCTISLDLASFEVVEASRDILEGILKEYVDVVFANEEEGERFTGLGNHQATVRRLAELCQVAALKLGAEGSLVASQDQCVTVAPIPVERLVDTTGAGDLWAGGFLYGWLSGRDLATCGQLGSQLGAEVVQVMGASLPPETWDRLSRQFHKGPTTAG